MDKVKWKCEKKRVLWDMHKKIVEMVCITKYLHGIYPQAKKLSTLKNVDFQGKIQLFTELSTLSTMDKLWIKCVNTKYMFCTKCKKRQKKAEWLDFLVVYWIKKKAVSLSVFYKKTVKL